MTDVFGLMPKADEILDGAQTFPGPSAERAGYWAASWLAQGGQPGPLRLT